MLYIFVTLVFGILSLFISPGSAGLGARVATPKSTPSSAISSTPSSTPTGKPIFFIAGDSTTCRCGPLGPKDEASPCATVGGKSINGWSQGFLNTFNNQIDFQSTGYSSSNDTLAVYRDTLSWMEVGNGIGNIVAYLPTDNIYTLLAFGHLDQLSPTAKATFSTDLNGAIDDILALFVSPILVTPLTNRAFKNGQVIEDLADITKDTIDVAKARNCTFIDLNAESTKYINAIGEKAAAKYDPSPSDKTNLTSDGGTVFGRLVNNLLLDLFPELAEYTIPDEATSGQLRSGVPA